MGKGHKKEIHRKEYKWLLNILKDTIRFMRKANQNKKSSVQIEIWVKIKKI